MPIRLPGSPSAPSAAPTGVRQSQAERDTEYLRQQDEARARQAPPPVQANYQPQPQARSHAPAAAGYGDDGFSKPPPSENGLPYANTFADRQPGRYTDLCCVEQIVRWATGPSVVLRVRVGEDAGREIRWDQTPPEAALRNEKWLTNWQRDLFGAYAAGGWPADPVESSGWGGWPRSRAGDYIPPYADFFVTVVGGLHVPILLAVTTQVDARNDGRAATYPAKVLAVRPHRIDGALVQAPLPRKLTPWIAERHLWTGKREDIIVKPKDDKPGYVVDCVRVTFDQIQRNVGGLKSLVDCT